MKKGEGGYKEYSLISILSLTMIMTLMRKTKAKGCVYVCGCDYNKKAGWLAGSLASLASNSKSINTSKQYLQQDINSDSGSGSGNNNNNNNLTQNKSNKTKDFHLLLIRQEN